MPGRGIAGPVSLRRGGRRDHPWMIELAQESFAGFGEYGEIISCWLDVRGVVSLVAEGPSGRLGYAIVAPHRVLAFLRAWSAELVAIVVSPASRAGGVGRCLLERAELVARGWSAGEMLLHTARENLGAQRFFRRAGYEVHGSAPTFYPRGQPAWEMRRRLP